MGTLTENISKYQKMVGSNYAGHWGKQIRPENYSQGIFNRIAHMFNRMENIVSYDKTNGTLMQETLDAFGQAYIKSRKESLYLTTNGYLDACDTLVALDQSLEPLHQSIIDLQGPYATLHSNELVGDEHQEERELLKIQTEFATGAFIFGINQLKVGIEKMNLLGTEQRGYFKEE